jgi:Leucine-rich repeat (LRR) protein
MITYEDSKGKIHEKKCSRIVLNLSMMKITQILNSNLTNLQSLNLAGNDIVEIKGLNELINIQALDLRRNKIMEIKGLDELTSLRYLGLADNRITEIKGLDKLTNLQTLSLVDNRITEIKGLDKLTNLQELNLSINKITKIQGLYELTSLRELALSNNQIIEIRGLDELTSLWKLILENNQITEIKGLDRLTSLQKLYLYNNRITKIKGLVTQVNLRDLDLRNNQITEIKGLDGTTNLQDLDLRNNQITEVPFTIMNLRNLNILQIDCNIHPIIERFLYKNLIKSNKTIYNDSQNVHDSNIVKSVKQSIYNIINESKDINIESVLKEIVDDKVLNKKTKSQLVEYCQDKTVHSLLNLTFDEVLCSVWKIITKHKESDEIKNILNDEMKDSMCKCFTGRLSRLVNSLNGFDDRISIKINDKEQILNVIINVRNKYDDLEKQKEEVIKELSERGFDQNTINEYIVYLE